MIQIWIPLIHWILSIKKKKDVKELEDFYGLRLLNKLKCLANSKKIIHFIADIFILQKKQELPQSSRKKKESFDHNFKTVVKLLNFKTSYREAARKTTSAIANNLLEHCLLYFFNNSCPVITIIDNEMN